MSDGVWAVFLVLLVAAALWVVFLTSGVLPALVLLVVTLVALVIAWRQAAS